MDDVTIEKARAAKAKVEQRLGAAAGVTGIGLTKVGRDWAVKVNVERLPAEGVDLPEKVGTVPVVVEVTGRIKARGR